MSRRYDYEPMTPEEFSASLNHHHLTMREYCYLTGYSPSTVERWLSGQMPVAHHARLIFLYWELNPHLLKSAAVLADEYSHDRREEAHAPVR